MLTFKGVPNLIKGLRQVANGTVKKVDSALYEKGEHIMGRSKSEFVPVDLGNLMNDGFVNPTERKGYVISVTMGYGGSADAYAVAVHEHPSEHSPPSWQGKEVTFNPSGRGPKYLERPLLEEERGLAEWIAKRIEVK